MYAEHHGEKIIKNVIVLGFANQVTYVTGFERTRLPRTQEEDTLFTITR